MSRSPDLYNMSPNEATNLGTEQEGVADSQPPRQKRRRIPIACNACRARKSRVS